MEIDRVSFLFGLVLGLALAAIVIAGAIILAPRGQSAGAAALTPAPSSTRLALATPATERSQTHRQSHRVVDPNAYRQAKPDRATHRDGDRAAAGACRKNIRYENLAVAPGRSLQLSIGAAAGQTLDLSLMVDSDIDLTVTDPTGTIVYGPQRVRRSYNSQLRSPAGGNYIVKLDNSFSIISTKQVLVQYRLLTTP